MPDQPRADRSLRALFDAVDATRPRTVDDGIDPAVPVAATVVIVRDASDGLDVLMIERPDRGSFAGAWVFPGGKLEAADGADGDGADGDGADGDGADGDEPAAARRAAVRETREEVGLELDAPALVPLSRWDPPPGIALRIRTWFFLARPPDGDLRLAPDEVVLARWVRPGEMLERHARGEVTLYPPTWVTLAELDDHPDAASAIDAARIGGLRRFETAARRGPAGPVMLWEADAAYGGSGDLGDEDGGTRHRLDLGALPWVYQRPIG